MRILFCLLLTTFVLHASAQYNLSSNPDDFLEKHDQYEKADLNPLTATAACVFKYVDDHPTLQVTTAPHEIYSVFPNTVHFTYTHRGSVSRTSWVCSNPTFYPEDLVVMNVRGNHRYATVLITGRDENAEMYIYLVVYDRITNTVSGSGSTGPGRIDPFHIKSDDLVRIDDDGWENFAVVYTHGLTVSVRTFRFTAGQHWHYYTLGPGGGAYEAFNGTHYMTKPDVSVEVNYEKVDDFNPAVYVSGVRNKHEILVHKSRLETPLNATVLSVFDKNPQSAPRIKLKGTVYLDEPVEYVIVYRFDDRIYVSSEDLQNRGQFIQCEISDGTLGYGSQDGIPGPDVTLANTEFVVAWTQYDHAQNYIPPHPQGGMGYSVVTTWFQTICNPNIQHYFVPESQTIVPMAYGSSVNGIKFGYDLVVFSFNKVYFDANGDLDNVQLHQKMSDVFNNFVTTKRVKKIIADTETPVTTKVYPNPFRNQLTIEGDFPAGAIISIYSADGRLVRNERLIKNTINTAALNQGFYLVRIVDRGRVVYGGTFVK